jgi:hypothetical protein
MYVCWKFIYLDDGLLSLFVPFLLPLRHSRATQVHGSTHTNTHNVCIYVRTYVPHIQTGICNAKILLPLSPNILQTLHQIHNTLLQVHELQAQHVPHPGVIVIVDAALGEVAALDLRPGQLVVVLREVLADDLQDLLVGELARGSEEALAGGLGNLHGFDVREGKVANLDPDVGPRVRDFILAFALDKVAGSLVRGV